MPRRPSIRHYLSHLRCLRRAAAGRATHTGAGHVSLHFWLHSQGGRHRDGRNGAGGDVSPCFGAPFLVWHPAKYAELLAKKLKEHKANVWLINTGWSGGSYGTGSRIKLKFTRAIINAIHAGALANASTQPDPIFGIQVVTRVPQVPADILIPEQTWSDRRAFAAAARKLAGLFVENFKKFESGVTPEVKAAGPKAD